LYCLDSKKFCLDSVSNSPRQNKTSLGMSCNHNKKSFRDFNAFSLDLSNANLSTFTIPVHCTMCILTFSYFVNGKASVITYSISRYSWNTSRRPAATLFTPLPFSILSFFIARDRLSSSSRPVKNLFPPACVYTRPQHGCIETYSPPR